MDETIRVDANEDQRLYLSKSPGDATIGKQDSQPEVDVIKDSSRFKADDDGDSKHRKSIRRSVTLSDNVKRRRNVSICLGTPNENGVMQVMTPKDMQDIQDIANRMQIEESAMSSPDTKKERYSQGKMTKDNY
jgi:hypothetical protein